MILEQPKSPFLMKAFFFAHLSREERHTIADKYLKSIEEFRGQLEAARPAVEAHADRFQVLVLSIGLRSFRDLARNVSENHPCFERRGG